MTVGSIHVFRKFRVALIACAFTLAWVGIASADQDQAMAEMMKYSMPGPAHEVLKPMAGDFKAVVKMWQGAGEPQASAGACRNTWVLGGRFLQSDYKGDFMGQTFEGLGFTGYDNMKKQYIGLWMDTMGTMVMISTGTADAASKAITMNSTMDDPTTGKAMPLRSVTKIIDDNQHVYSMYGAYEGKEQLMMEITYTRAK